MPSETEATAPTNVGRTPYDRLMARTVRTASGCLEFTGSKTAAGYAQVSAPGGRKTAPLTGHRVVWEHEHGPIPPGMEVRHEVCDNPPCVEIAHLSLGTHAQNMADMAAHRRGRKPADRKVCRRGHDMDVVGRKPRRGVHGVFYVCRECSREDVRRSRGRATA